MAPMQSWSFGYELFEKEDKEHDLLDRDFRFFAEECDQMQGVVVFAGADDAWGGFTKGYVEKLRDELGKGVIWVWALDSAGDEEQSSSVSHSIDSQSSSNRFDREGGLKDCKILCSHYMA
jgi:Tubulin domain